MKKILILFLAIGLLGACNNATKDFDKKDKAKTEKGDDDDGRNEDDDNDDGGGGSWSKKERNKFMEDCEDGLGQQGYSGAQARQLCSCVLNKVEKRYSSMREADEKGGAEAGTKAMLECAGGGGGNFDNGGDDDDEN